jgi:hypothetical protein
MLFRAGFPFPPLANVSFLHTFPVPSGPRMCCFCTLRPANVVFLYTFSRSRPVYPPGAEADEGIAARKTRRGLQLPCNIPQHSPYIQASSGLPVLAVTLLARYLLSLIDDRRQATTDNFLPGNNFLS